MRSVFGLVLIVGIALAGAAVYMAKNYISQTQSELSRERAARQQVVKTVDIYVATRPLKYGEPLTAEDVKLTKFPQNSLPEGVFFKEEELFPQGQKELRVVLRMIETNEALMAIKVTEPGESAGLTSQLRRGMRAFAIKVDAASGVSGFLRPGDRVDVYWTGRVVGTDGRDTMDVTKLIEAGVGIIAVDQTANNDSSEATIARTVTVAALPQQVAALAQAQSTGKLSLSLVGADDDTIATSVEVDQRSLLGLASAPVAVQQAEDKICTIRTRKGAEVLELPIPCTN